MSEHAIAQIDAHATLRGLDIWYEVKIYDRGEMPTGNYAGCSPNYQVGRVFVDHDWRDPEREQLTDLTDAEMKSLDEWAEYTVWEALHDGNY